MITLLTTLALAADPVPTMVGDSMSPEFAKQLEAYKASAGECATELTAVQHELEVCEAGLAAIKATKSRAKARVLTVVPPHLVITEDPPAPPEQPVDALAEILAEQPPVEEPPEATAAEDEPDVEVPVTVLVNNNSIVPPDVDVVDEAADEPTSNPPSASADGSRFQVLAGGSGGFAIYAAQVKDGAGAVVASNYSVPLNFWGGATMSEHRGFTLGILAHGGVDPITFGSHVAGGVMVTGLLGPARIGLEVGGSYTAFKSLVGAGADAWISGGEVLAVGLVPFGHETNPVRVNLLVAGGVDGGLLQNVNPLDTTYALLPVAHVGLVFSFNTKQF